MTYKKVLNSGYISSDHTFEYDGMIPLLPDTEENEATKSEYEYAIEDMDYTELLNAVQNTIFNDERFKVTHFNKSYFSHHDVIHEIDEQMQEYDPGLELIQDEINNIKHGARYEDAHLFNALDKILDFMEKYEKIIW